MSTNSTLDLPTYPAVAPIVVNAVIKDNIIRKDHRSFNRYLRLVIDHLKPHISDDGTEKKNVKGFCEYVDRLLNESSLKCGDCFSNLLQGFRK